VGEVPGALRIMDWSLFSPRNRVNSAEIGFKISRLVSVPGVQGSPQDSGEHHIPGTIDLEAVEGSVWTFVAVPAPSDNAA
jgi:hypothetical protein